MHSTVKPLAIGLEDAATMIGVASRTLRKWSTERRIASVKLGGRLVFRISELEKFLAENERPAVAAPRR